MATISVQDVTVGEGDGHVDVLVSLSEAVNNTVTVGYATASYTADTNDYGSLSGTLSFSPGETSKVVRITIEDRFTDVETAERFKLVLSSPTNATLAREGYGWITVIDNNTVKNNPDIYVGDIVIDESAGTASFQVTLGRALGQSSTGTVSVAYATVDGTAAAGSDYTAKNGTLTFLPGQSVKTVTIDLLNDSLAEGAETFGLSLSNATTGVIVRGNATATIGANDAATVSQPKITVADLTVGEGDTYADVIVSLSAPSQNAVTVGYATASWTADTNDYDTLSGTLTFNPGETTKVVRIDIEDRFTDAEVIERFKLVLSSPTNATLGREGYGWITIVDNNTAKNNPDIVVGDIVVDEAAGTASFQVMLGRTLGQSATSTVTVDYATVDGSAIAGSDYAAKSGTLSFLPGESVKTVTIDLLNDSLAEAAETFGLKLSNASTGVIARGSATATIGANDAAPVAQPKITVSDLTVGEGDTYADVVVTLSAPSQSTVTVGYATASWTADTNDYDTLSGTLTFNPGETTKVVRIDIEDRFTDAEVIERFKLVLSSPTNATLGREGYGWVTIVDNNTVKNNPEIHVRDIVVDEAAGTASFQVTLGRALGQSATGTVTVDYSTVDGSATAGSDYTAKSGTLSFLPGESVKTVTIELLNDSLAEGAETFGLNLSNATTGVIVRSSATAAIGANDATAVSQPKISVSDLTVGEGDTYADVIVSLSAPSQNTVTVGYATASWTADTNDYDSLSGTLTFNPGETTKVVRLDIEDRFTDAEVIERFKLVLSNPTNATLGREGYGWVTIVDNNTVKDNPEIHVRDIVVDESAGTASFQVTLGRTLGQSAGGTVSVDFATADGSASAGSDYLAKSGTLTFLPGESVKTVTVDLLNDTTPESTETFSLVLSNAATGVIVRDTATATIAPNDALAVSQPRISVAELTVGESDIYADVVVTLSAPSQSKVTAAYTTVSATADTNDYDTLSGTLSFEPGETVKVVRIDLENSTGVESIERFKLQLSAPSGATLNGDGYGWINIVDDDTVSENPSIVISDLVVDEKAGTANFGVTLGNQFGTRSASTITVKYTTVDGSATAGSDYLARSGTLTFLPGETAKTVSIAIIDDSVGESAETFKLNLSDPVNAVIATSSATATISANSGVAQPSYTLVAGASSYNEGANATFTLTTTNVANGTVLPYALSGTVSAADISGGVVSGSVTVNNNTATITVPLVNDQKTEGTETLTVSITGTSATASTSVVDTSIAAPVVSYTVAGTLGIDYLIPAAGNSYLGGKGDDIYIISSSTLSGTVTASITDSEGANIIQLVDGLSIVSSLFLANALQLTLSTGAVVQVLGASSFTFQIGANLIAGDASTSLTYAQFVAALGATLPTGSGSVAGTPNFLVPTLFTQAPPITPVASGNALTVAGTLGNDFMVLAGGNNYLGGAGSDTYLVGGNTLSGAVTASITDTEGNNVIQLVDGTVIASSLFLNDALQLTLSTGAKIQVLGSSKFQFQVGANAAAGDTAPTLTFAQFAAQLGGSVPAVGGSAVNGTANFTVPTGSGSGFTVVNLGVNNVTATSAAEEFRFDFQIVNGRATTAGDGAVTITGFDVTKDKLVFVNTSNSTVYTEAQFKVLPGVVLSESPFNLSTTIVFDPAAGVIGGVTLTGVVDAALNQIVVETVGA